MLKSNFLSKNKKVIKPKKEDKFLKPFFKLFLNIYTGLGYLICLKFQFNSQSMGRPEDKRKAARAPVCWVKKRIPGNKPIAGAMSASQKLQLLESDSVT